MYRSMKKDVETQRAPSKRRGRPRAFDRDAALEAATRLFWERGYEATSISDLTAALGIGSPSLYAAFGSKEALYAESVEHYRTRYESLVWDRFFAAPTAREAVSGLLHDSAAALSGELADIPRGCMVTLSAVGSEGNEQLGELVRKARYLTYERLRDRIGKAVAEGELPADVDVEGLARFVQTVQNGMSILARDRVGRAPLEAVARVAMAGWDREAGLESPES